jgi:SAM-dependent methyltransferase
MVDLSDIERRVGAYYTSRVEEHGATPLGVDWNSHASQRLRFVQLLTVARPEGELSINDYGCGYGGLLDYIDALKRTVRYHGHDVSEAMIACATARHEGRQDATFATDPAALPQADITVASGIFNVLAGSDESGWEDYVRATVMRMAKLSRRGIAFNMLTSYSDPGRITPRLHYADPCEMFDWCKRELSRHVALLHDYGLWEFTMIVRFDESGGSR